MKVARRLLEKDPKILNLKSIWHHTETHNDAYIVRATSS
jgi:hypothetical protein